MPVFTTRPVVMGTRGVVTSGHYLATVAGFRIMEQGGNAIDAAAAMSFCLALLEPHLCGLGGEVPTLIYSAAEGKTYGLSGMGWTPQAFTIDWCRENGVDLIPDDGYLPACTPAVVGTWTEALARFGTMSLGQVLQPAIELAENGYPIDAQSQASLAANAKRYLEEYPTTAEVYCPGGVAPQVGDIVRYPDWANTLKTLVAAEKEGSRRSRIAGLEAARDAFYAGPIAERILDFIRTPIPDKTGRSHAGLFTLTDLAEWRAILDEPVTYQYHGLDVHKCSSWTQGPVFVQQLALLDGFDLPALGHNTADYIHVVTEVIKLAFADREAYYGDPLFDHVPFDVLLSKGYNEQRRQLIGPHASRELRPGDVGHGIPTYATVDVLTDNRRGLALAPVGAERVLAGAGHIGDTSHLDAIDRVGNMVAATPSGGWIGSSPVIPGLGFPLGTRGQMFYLNATRPNALAGHKRPRATLTPTLVTRQGKPYMAFGTPGGDGQDQWTVQFFLNYVDFGMDIQAATDAPTFHSLHFPSSFYPRTAYPARLVVEDRISPAVREELARRGHEVVLTEGWANGKVMGIRYDTERGVILGGASPRRNLGYALGW